MINKWQTITSLYFVTAHGRHCVSNQRQLDRLLNRLFRLTTEKYRWFPLTEDQQCREHFHVIPSSRKINEYVQNFQTIFHWVLLKTSRYLTQAWPWPFTCVLFYINGPNGHLFYVGGDLMMRRGMLPIIMLPDGDLRIVLHLVPFWILTIWGNVHIEETVVGWRNQLRMKTSAT